MYLLFETIKCFERRLYNLGHHQERFNRSRKALWDSEPLSLAEYVMVPGTVGNGLYKCRFLYGETAGPVEFIPYEPRTVRSLKIVYSNTICYDHKFTDRHDIDGLYSGRGQYDDILIVKDNRITDTSISNIAFFDGTRWVTPSTPILYGTKRALLLAEGRIREGEVLVHDLRHFRYARLINAMLVWEGGYDIPAHRIDY